MAPTANTGQFQREIELAPMARARLYREMEQP
jgi:hypothetical protein